MKKILVLTVLVLLAMAMWIAAEDIQVGKVVVPQAFVHAGKDYAAGAYQLTLTDKEGVPTFIVSQKGTPLFEEMAAVKVNAEGQGKTFRPRIKKGMLKENEYYRVRVTTPAQHLMMYFLIKK